MIRKLSDQRQEYLTQRLRTLLDLREHADYDLDTPVDEGHAAKAMGLAADLVPRLRSL